jgi:hypothetical protein
MLAWWAGDGLRSNGRHEVQSKIALSINSHMGIVVLTPTSGNLPNARCSPGKCGGQRPVWAVGFGCSRDTRSLSWDSGPAMLVGTPCADGSRPCGLLAVSRGGTLDTRGHPAFVLEASRLSGVGLGLFGVWCHWVGAEEAWVGEETVKVNLPSFLKLGDVERVWLQVRS